MRSAQIFSFLIVAALALSFRDNPGYEVEFLGPDVNGRTDELNPLITPDGQKLFFIREDDPQNTMHPEHTQDIWMCKLENGKWSAARHLNAPFNQQYYSAMVGFSADGNTRYLKGYYSKGEFQKDGFSYCTLGKNGWSEPKGMKVKNYEKLNAEGTSVSSNMHSSNNILLMSFVPKKKRTHDIYVSFREDENSFTEPAPIGLNTDAYDEFSPFLASDGVTLYFSSNRQGGYGDADIWMTRRLDSTWQKWSEPINLGPEVNSADWDAWYSISAKGDEAYLTKQNGSNNGDICRVKLREEVRPEPVVLIRGKVLDKVTGRPVSAAVIYELLPGATVVGTAISNEETGEYQIVLPFGSNYGFNAKAKGYYASSENMDLTHLTAYQELTRDLYLVPIETGQVVRLNNIFFETGKSELKPESFPELDRVVKMLQENPQMTIEIAGHTDNVGTDTDNKTLSAKRSEAVVSYLVAHGIAASRLTSKGYGEEKPVDTNDTEQGRAMNRRVEFTITGK
jgi:outer membrane protein OmpA-like peptidoglycan-associated protein